MVEFGYLNLLLTVWNGDKVISIQPFNVMVYDDYMGGASSFIELIQELQRLIENMVGDLNNTVKLTDKGVPNGVASLDELGKIPLVQMPQEFQGFLDHINHTVFEHRVHGLGLDDDEQLMYQDNNGDWQYIGFSPTGVGGGATQTVSASISVANSVATVIYSGVPTVVQSKWSTGDNSISYFALNGSSFTGNTFPISSIGIHTLYYKDSNGLEYVKTFNVTMDMIARPNVTINVEDGYVTVTIPPNVSTSIKKWAKGNQTVSYFAYNGTVFTGNTFQVTEVGTYTVYIKTTGGLEYVYTFDVTEAMLPVISKPSIVLNSFSYTYDNSSTLNSYSLYANIFDEKYRITKVKPPNSSNYTEISSPIPANTVTNYSLGVLNYTLASNKQKELIFGVENEKGDRKEIILYLDSNYLYTWSSGSNVTIVDIIPSSPLNTSSSIVIPSTIRGNAIDTFGVSNSFIAPQNQHLTTLTIPTSISQLYAVFTSANKLKTVNINNPNIEFLSRTGWSRYAFYQSTELITMKSSGKSTTETFVQERQGDNSYKLQFQAT